MAPTSPKTFAIGDIHGCHDKLVTLLGRLPFDKNKDTLVFLGDYINRGPDSKRVLDALIGLKTTCKNVVFLKGNHEQALLEYSATGDVETLNLLRRMGIEATAGSYGSSVRQLLGLSCLPEEHRNFLHTLEFAHIAGATIFTHADIDQEMITAIKNQEEQPAPRCFLETALLSSRRLTREDADTYGYTIIFGHSPLEFPLVMPNRIGIDTGAVYGNVLTALELPNMHFHHA